MISQVAAWLAVGGQEFLGCVVPGKSAEGERSSSTCYSSLLPKASRKPTTNGGSWVHTTENPEKGTVGSSQIWYDRDDQVR